MKDSTKNTLKLLATTNIRNDDTLIAAKTAPWWIPMILGLVSIVIPLIPIMTSVSKTHGASIFASSNFGMDLTNTGAFLELKEEGYDFKVDGNKQLLSYKDGELRTVFQEDEPLAQYISVSPEGIQQIEYQIYYFDSANNKDIAAFSKELNEERYIVGTTTKYVPEETPSSLYFDGSESESSEATSEETSEAPSSVDTYYRPSYLLLFKTGMALQIFERNGVKRKSAVSGDWYHTAQDEFIIEKMLKTEAKPEIDFTKDANGAYKVLRDPSYLKDVHKNFSKTLDEVYTEIKTRTFWSYTGIFFGVYFAVIVFMALLCFLLTRGKNNPMNYLTFWTCVKMVCWASFAPALLAMIAGFILSSYASMFFIVLMGMRIMWLSMKQLRPAQ